MTIERHGVTASLEEAPLFTRFRIVVDGVTALDRAYPSPISWATAIYDLEQEGLEEWQLELVEGGLEVVL